MWPAGNGVRLGTRVHASLSLGSGSLAAAVRLARVSSSLRFRYPAYPGAAGQPLLQPQAADTCSAFLAPTTTTVAVAWGLAARPPQFRTEADI